jgi:phosphoglycolate phosphatase
MQTAFDWRQADVRAVIVDLDGTMVDTAPDFQVALNHMLSRLELPSVSQAEVIDCVGKGTDHLLRGILGKFLNAAQVEQRFEQARALYMDHYLAINGMHSALYPEVAEGLAAMRELGLRMACVTNKPYRLACDLLEKTGLASNFELVYGGDSLPRKKPDPLPMLQVAQDFGLRPEQILAIGDSSNDAQAARSAGCKVLIVPYGYNHGLPVQTIDADGIVGSLNEAARLLARP